MNPVDDLTALTLTMIGEARGEGIPGMTAVGNTVMNRVHLLKWFGFTPMQVCLKHSASGIYQYSCWNQRDPNRPFLLTLRETDTLYQHAEPLAQGLIDGTIADCTQGATHYYAEGIPVPFWALDKTPCAKIGGQLFFNNIN